MAKINGIDTNLSEKELGNVLKALATDKVTFDPASGILAISSGAGEFTHNGSRYSISENWEVIKTLNRIS